MKRLFGILGFSVLVLLMCKGTSQAQCDFLKISTEYYTVLGGSAGKYANTNKYADYLMRLEDIGKDMQKEMGLFARACRHELCYF